MARQMRTPRYPAVFKGSYGEIQPCFRAPIAPGETLKRLKAMYNIQSAPHNAPLAGAWVDFAFYYVPLRLCDATFPAKIMAGNWTETKIDFSTAGMNEAFFSGPAGVNTLFVRAYELVVNRYYRDIEIQGPFPTLTGTSNALAPALIADRTAETFGAVTADMPDQLVDLSGTSPNQKLSVRALWDAEQALRTKDARENMDATYTGFLEAYGVSRDDGEGFLMEPELITATRKWVMPSKAVDEATGETVQSYFVSGEHDFKGRKYFQEHGYIVGVAMMRPKYFFAGKTGQADDAFTNFWQDATGVWPIEGDPDKTVASTAWIASEEFNVDMRNILYRGEQLIGKGVDDVVASTAETFVLYKNPVTLADTLKGTNLPWATSAISLGAAYQCDATYRLEVATPIARPPRY